MHSLALFLSLSLFFFQQPLQRLDAYRLAFFSSSHCDWVGWVGDKPRRKEGLFESLFITCVVALNLPFPITRSTLKLINAQLGECGLYVIKPLPRSALPLNLAWSVLVNSRLLTGGGLTTLDLGGLLL